MKHGRGRRATTTDIECGLPTETRLLAHHSGWGLNLRSAEADDQLPVKYVNAILGVMEGE